MVPNCSGFMDLFWVFARGKTGRANLTDKSVTASRRTELSPVKDDLEVQVIPALSEKNLFKVALSLYDIASTSQSPALGEAMNVCIDRETGNAEGLSHYDARCLVSHTGKSFQ